MDFSNHNCIVSGSRGLLGSAFVDYCKENKIRYQTLLPFPCDLETLKERLSGGRITHFFNCAGFSNDVASISQPYECYKSNVTCVLNQLESIRNFSPKTKYVNFGSVYENEKVTPYGSSKRMARELVRTYRQQYGISTFQATLSFTEYYREDADRMLVKIIRKLIEAKKQAQSVLTIRNSDGLPFVSPIKLYNPDDRFNFTWASDVVEHCFIDIEEDTEDNPYWFNSLSFSLKDIVKMITDELELSKNLVEFDTNENNGSYYRDDRANSFVGKVTMKEIVARLVKFELKMSEKKVAELDRQTYGKPT